MIDKTQMASWILAAGPDVLPPIGQDVWALADLPPESSVHPGPVVFRGTTVMEQGDSKPRFLVAEYTVYRDEEICKIPAQVLHSHWTIIAWRPA